jgi:hypothetical protein
MNQDQIMSLIRIVAGIVSGMLLTKGAISADDSNMLVSGVITIAGAIVGVAPIIWGIFAHTHTSMIQSVNAADNGVKVVSSASPALEVNEPIDMLKKGN